MPRVSIQQTNFTAGEISPRLIGRTDIDRYANAAALLINAHPVIHGGAKNRSGTRYVAPAKEAAKAARLIPFVVSRDEAYQLEFGHNFVRVYAAGGAAAHIVELATSYTEAMLPDLDYVQGESTMFLAHPDVPLQRLRRISSTTWELVAAPLQVVPFDEIGHTQAIGITLGSAGVGATTATSAAGDIFLPGDVGRVLTWGTGAATITAWGSTLGVSVNVTSPFASTTLPAGEWVIDSSPQAYVRASADGPVGSTIKLNAALGRSAGITLSAFTGAGVTVTASTGVFSALDVGRMLYADEGVATITGYTSATVITVEVTTDFVFKEAAAGGWGITGSIWRPADLGRYVRINGGLVRITSLPSTLSAEGVVVQALDSIVVSPPLAWSLEDALWSARLGYPRTVTLHEQRLWAAGTKTFPQRLWGSVTGEYLNFTKGSNDTDACDFTLAADEINPISYLASLRSLVVHTYGGEFSVQGGVEKPITPTNVRIRSESPHGSKGVRPVTVGKESIFVQRAGRKVRAMGYRYDFDGYASPDLSVLAEHITTSGITSMAYQQEPDLLLWATRADGTLLSCTLDRDQQVTGWARHYTTGAVEWVSTIPNGAREEVWLLVRRKISGATVRYIEVMDETWEPIYPSATDPDAFPPFELPRVYGLTLDAAKEFNSPAGATSFSAPHLAGCEVGIVADGAVQGRQTVPAGGTITLGRPAKRVLIGLPFRVQITPLTPEVGTGTGTAQGNAMRTGEVTLRLLDTVGGKVVDSEGGEQQLPSRRIGSDVLDQPPEVRTGNVRTELLGWARGASTFSIVQDDPLPIHVLSVVRKFTVND